ncbi:FKBP-type peptidyl-prolyl cis-trans isomerase FklB [Xylanibacter ruminicola]|jgi:FKBP-type peptidyl-prolyl cis-trans isomerase FklB|uniref:Peptidyl-prolyl cis-trans isomerase n=1 Tax=Xylanibacter ruminicola TaxID=839 RepID=A0A1H5XE66_XYLRU|nr:FKBP-type peptidyl-prolyl cis-trans isomerase [Xylanibacter ruminicola]MCR5470379.1 FKBP-type peptidyl-prolyl cis-trans isomerase [Prevotella sp.]SEG10009.1 FKBP-type peptidyl-prolyl cis-trans isomerase FklB [Xylanibacter ruminicola]
MKKTICVALALVAGASLFTAEAAKKKTVQKPVEEKVQAVQLTSSSDSVSYAAGMTMTNGLLNYLLQQKMDTTMMADFVRGFMDAVKTADDPKMKAYMTGQNIAQQLNERMLPSLKTEFQDSPDSIMADVLYRGFTDAMLNDTTIFTLQKAEDYFSARQKADKAARDEKLYGANREAGIKFLEENAKNDSVITLPSGLQYKVLVKGSGAVPQSSDKVKVHYEGRLIDGKVFDSSYQRGEPSEFTPTQVIRGWTEALTMMPVGSKWQLYIPYELAYGERGAGADIKPYSMLIFDVELLEIVK